MNRNRLSNKEFTDKANKIHNFRYDYSLAEYTGTYNKLKVICKEHGLYEVSPNNHLNGQNCPKCSGKVPVRENYRIEGDKVYLQLTKGFEAIVDIDDLGKVSMYTWYTHINKYAAARIDGKATLLHRYILDASDDLCVDHRDNNGFNNSRSNIRLCTKMQNQYNQRPSKGKKYKGVYWIKERSKWRVEISCDGYRYRIGYFTNEEDAARAYDAKAIELHGEFAWLNIK